jgi:hypothetical protein
VANNPYVNKVVFGGVAIVDITPTTAVESDVATGKVFFKADGSQAIGTHVDSAGGRITQDANGYIHLSETGDLVAEVPLSVNANGTYTPQSGYAYSSVEVNVSGGGGVASVDESDVNFYDYDGTCVAAYTAAEFANLVALPDNPSHDGLTAQGWNWTLADAKTYVAAHGWLHIGQLYITDDGKTRIYISIPSNAPEAFRLFTIRYRQTVANGVKVDWGDGSDNTYSGTSAANHDHTYASGGNYTITLEAVNGDLYLDSVIWGSSNSATRYKGAYIVKAEIGNVKAISGSCFSQCRCITAVSIPRGVTFSDASGVFSGCGTLRFVTLPPTATIIGSSMFSYCSGLMAVAVPKETTSIGASAFLSCGSLRRVIIPEGATELGNQTFNNNSAMQFVRIPSTVTSIGTQVFTNNFPTMEYHIEPTTPPTLANTNAFTGIVANCKMYVPSASLDAYKTATNWSTYASRMVGE